MFSSKEQKFVDVARKYINGESKNQHVSLLVIRNKILSVGVNDYIKTHTFAHSNNYRYSHIHSELSCLRRFPWRNFDIKKATIINLRFARKDNSLLLSRPCFNCLDLIGSFGVKYIIYSTPNGFEKL